MFKLRNIACFSLLNRTQVIKLYSRIKHSLSGNALVKVIICFCENEAYQISPNCYIFKKNLQGLYADFKEKNRRNKERN